jgi:hypothetical protein
MTEKTLEAVLPEDETKPTGTQEEVPSQDEEESDEGIDIPDDDSDNEDGAERKPFKDRKERAEFFKQKQTAEKKDDKAALTKGDLFKINEKRAIRLATTPSDADSAEIKAIKADLNANWSDVIAFFNKNTDRSDPENIIEALYDAHTVWRRRNPKQTEVDDTDTKARKALMREQGVRGSSSKGSDAPKKTVLGSPSRGMDDWYPKKD